LSPQDQRLLDLAGVRYLLTVRKPRVAGQRAGYQDVFEDNGVAVYENATALPRAYIVYQATAAPDLPTARQALLAPTFDPRRAVILTGGGIPLAGPDQNTATTPVTWLRDDPEAIELTATLSAPGYLILSDDDAPGWTASADGMPASILRAN